MSQKTPEDKKQYNKEYYQRKKEESKCEHGRQKSVCKDCGGTSICEHGRQRSRCKDCGGCSICEHNRDKSRCRECGGSQICEHGRQRNRCKNCGGSQICEHGRLRSRCKYCEGSSCCEHGRRRNECKDCGGTSFCEHGRRRNTCKVCRGSQICEHGQHKSQCKDCSPLLVIIQIQRKNIRRQLLRSNLEKTQSTVEYLGCNAFYFQEYIKLKMTIEMTFDNIHYDHIKPICAFNLDDPEEFLQCCNYTNFQPLLAEQNLQKSGKWSEEDEIFWKENIMNKEYFSLYIPE